MNVTFGLVAAWVAFCLGAAGVKGKASGYSLGATLVQLLRGNWVYAADSQSGPSPSFQSSTPQNPAGQQTIPVPAGPGINPGGPFQAPSSLQAPPQAGQVNL